MPNSRNAAKVCSWGASGSTPALQASKRSPAIWLSSASPIRERAELALHRNSTLNLLSMPPSSAEAPGDVVVGALVARVGEDPVGAVHLHQVADRKSTRLNSSHVRISYAVFCLKKKKKSSTQSRAQPPASLMSCGLEPRRASSCR